MLAVHPTIGGYVSAPLLLAVDPGLHGALALWNPQLELLEVHDMPTFSITRNGKKRREIDLYTLANLIDSEARNIGRAVVEQVGAMPNQGVASTFTFGKATGIVLGMIAAHLIPLVEVSPAVWKRHMGVTADKDSSRKKASSLLPHCAKFWPQANHDGRAEAALLAIYADRHL